jgi:hypothetical protein
MILYYMVKYVTYNIISKLVVIYLVLYGICGLLLLMLLDTFCQIKKKQKMVWPAKMRPASRAAPTQTVKGGAHPI